MNLVDLDSTTRVLMLDELEYDIERKNLYLSTRLSHHGRRVYIDTLRDALATGTPASLALALSRPGLLNAFIQRRDGRTQAMPSDAPNMLAEGEFNRYYVRAVCRLAIDEGDGEVVVYRARPVRQPRPESQRRIGVVLDAQRLLDDLRSHVGVQTALGVPTGPNSGLSVHISR